MHKSKLKIPDLLPENPGSGHSFKVAYADAENTWEEEINLVKALAFVLSEHGISFNEYEKFLIILNEVIVQPQFLSLQPTEDGGAGTSTTIQLTSEKYFPNGLFEYQHSSGNNVKDSVQKGFSNWVRTDLKTILEAIEGLAECTSLQVKFPDRVTGRVVVFGPVTCYASQNSIEVEEHPFCPCCFFTNNYETFNSLLYNDDVYGIRFFVIRNEDGRIEADCRVNGKEFEKGKEALVQYGKTWPDKGLEFRKQYVLIKSQSKELDQKNIETELGGSLFPRPLKEGDPMNDIQFTHLKEEDIETLILPMTRAFDHDAALYENVEKGGPPGYNDGSFLRKWAFENKESLSYKITFNQIAVGAFILWWNKDGDSVLGNMFIDPDYHNRHIGRKAWAFIEKNFPSKRWKLETPIFATRNHHFYENICGFKKNGFKENQIVFIKEMDSQ